MSNSQASDDQKPATRADKQQNQVQCEVGSNDVVMGRGSGANLKEGNIRFRQLVWDRYKDKISQAKGVTMEESVAIKNRLSEEVLLHVKASGGRFLRKTLKQDKQASDAKNNDGGLGQIGTQVVYEAVSDKEAIDKIKQTLRFQIERRNGHRDRSKSLEALRYGGFLSSAGPSSQAMDDHLLQLISQQRIAKLIEGKNNEMMISRVRSIDTDNSIASAPAIKGSNAASWPSLLSAAPAAPAVAPTDRNMTRPSQPHFNNGTLLRETSQRLENSLDMRYLSLPAVTALQRPATTSFLQPHIISLESLAKLATLASKMPSATQNQQLLSTFNVSHPSASGNHQRDIESLIQHEELKLMLERIKTRRLSEMLQQSNFNVGT